jgi:hypothetical protein
LTASASRSPVSSVEGPVGKAQSTGGPRERAHRSHDSPCGAGSGPRSRRSRRPRGALSSGLRGLGVRGNLGERPEETARRGTSRPSAQVHPRESS